MPDTVTGRCYCGAISVTAVNPQTVTYCHCQDCRRWTGAPLPAFAAFARANVSLEPAPEAKCFAKGVNRWCCPHCGSPLAAEFDYLPDQTYVPLGILDQADALQPERHAHADRQLPWLNLDDSLPRSGGSARDVLGRDAK